jgi:hypothetical protein
VGYVHHRAVTLAVVVIAVICQRNDASRFAGTATNGPASNDADAGISTDGNESAQSRYFALFIQSRYLALFILNVSLYVEALRKAPELLTACGL